ncbi:MAG: hypothetical protein IJN29_13400 [Akkermansia sp.]|nr:hypothetical protein [Akkermansia sp.]
MIPNKLHLFLLASVLLTPGCSRLHIQQQQKELVKVKAQWRQQSYERTMKAKDEQFRQWKEQLRTLASAELVHKAPTEENPTPTIIIKLTPAEVKELAAILSKALPGRMPHPDDYIKPGSEPFKLNEHGEIIRDLDKELLSFNPIDERTDFLHLYDADGNDIVPLLSPWEDDICPLSELEPVSLRRLSTPAAQPFLILPDRDDWTRYRSLPSVQKFHAAVQKITQRP